MADEDADIKINVRGEARDAEKALHDAEKAVRKLEKKLKDLGVAEDKAADGQDDLKQRMDKAKLAAGALGGRYGELSERLDKVTRLMGPAGLAAGVFTLSLTAAVAGSVSLVRHLGGVIDRADELRAVGVGLDDGHVQTIRDANTALDRLSGTAEGALVVFGGESGLAAAVGDAADLFRGIIGPTLRAAGAVHSFFQAFDLLGPALSFAADATAGLREEQDRMADEGTRAYDAITEAALRYAETIGIAEQRQQDLADTIKASMEIAAREQAKIDRQAEAAAAAEQRRIEQAAALAMGLLEQEVDATVAAEEKKRQQSLETAQAHEAALRAILAAEQEVSAAEIALRRETEEEVRRLRGFAAQQAIDGVVSLEGQITSALMGQLDARNTAHRKAAMALWFADRATAIARVAALTPPAIMAAVASAPPPFNIPAIIGQTIASAAQAAAAGAVPPPTFHKGTTAADEMAATIKRNELIVTAQGRETAARSGVGDLNAGITQAPEIYVLAQAGPHRVSQRASIDLVRSSPQVRRAYGVRKERPGRRIKAGR